MDKLFIEGIQWRIEITLKQEVGYICVICNKNRYVRIDPKSHLEKVAHSPNGLSEISDIHYCVDGMLSINNLHVDHNFSVRSFSLIELPDGKRQSQTGIPMPKQMTTLNTYKIDKMVEEGGYRVRLIDHRLRVNLNIGEIPLSEENLDQFISNDGHVELLYYECGIPLRLANRLWFNELINTLEILPPTKIGLFIETLRFVYANNDDKPDYFGTQQLKTLLTAHHTTMKVIPHNYKQLRNITNKYGIEKRETIDSLIKLLKDSPKLSLRQIQELLKIDLVYLIFLSIILEIENVIEINRDDMINNL